MRDGQAAVATVALIDPPRARALVEQVQRQMTPEHRRHIPHPWSPMPDVTCSDGRELPRMITEDLFPRWPIDTKD